MTSSDLLVLNFLRFKKGYFSAREISKEINLSKNTIRRVLYDLERDDWAEGKVFCIATGGYERKYQLSSKAQEFVSPNK